MGLLITKQHFRRFVLQTFRHLTNPGSCAIGCSRLLFMVFVWHSGGTQLYRQLLFVWQLPFFTHMKSYLFSLTWKARNFLSFHFYSFSGATKSVP